MANQRNTVVLEDHIHSIDTQINSQKNKLAANKFDFVAEMSMYNLQKERESLLQNKKFSSNEKSMMPSGPMSHGTPFFVEPHGSSDDKRESKLRERELASLKTKENLSKIQRLIHLEAKTKGITLRSSTQINTELKGNDNLIIGTDPRQMESIVNKESLGQLQKAFEEIDRSLTPVKTTEMTENHEERTISAIDTIAPSPSRINEETTMDTLNISENMPIHLQIIRDDLDESDDLETRIPLRSHEDIKDYPLDEIFSHDNLENQLLQAKPEISVIIDPHTAVGWEEKTSVLEMPSDDMLSGSYELLAQMDGFSQPGEKHDSLSSIEINEISLSSESLTSADKEIWQLIDDFEEMSQNFIQSPLEESAKIDTSLVAVEKISLTEAEMLAEIEFLSQGLARNREAKEEESTPILSPEADTNSGATNHLENGSISQVGLDASKEIANISITKREITNVEVFPTPSDKNTDPNSLGNQESDDANIQKPYFQVEPPVAGIVAGQTIHYNEAGTMKLSDDAIDSIIANIEMKREAANRAQILANKKTEISEPVRNISSEIAKSIENQIKKANKHKVETDDNGKNIFRNDLDMSSKIKESTFIDLFPTSPGLEPPGTNQMPKQTKDKVNQMMEISEQIIDPLESIYMSLISKDFDNGNVSITVLANILTGFQKLFNGIYNGIINGPRASRRELESNLIETCSLGITSMYKQENQFILELSVLNLAHGEKEINHERMNEIQLTYQKTIEKLNVLLGIRTDEGFIEATNDIGFNVIHYTYSDWLNILSRSDISLQMAFESTKSEMDLFISGIEMNHVLDHLADMEKPTLERFEKIGQIVSYSTRSFILEFVEEGSNDYIVGVASNEVKHAMESAVFIGSHVNAVIEKESFAGKTIVNWYIVQVELI